MWRKTFNEVWVSWNHGWLQYPPWVWDRLGPYGVLLCSRSRNQTKSSAPAPINHISYTSASICASRLSSWLSIDVKNLVELSCLKPPFSPLRFWMLTLSTVIKWYPTVMQQDTSVALTSVAVCWSRHCWIRIISTGVRPSRHHVVRSWAVLLASIALSYLTQPLCGLHTIYIYPSCSLRRSIYG